MYFLDNLGVAGFISSWSDWCRTAHAEVGWQILVRTLMSENDLLLWKEVILLVYKYVSLYFICKLVCDSFELKIKLIIHVCFYVCKYWTGRESNMQTNSIFKIGWHEPFRCEVPAIHNHHEAVTSHNIIRLAGHRQGN